MGRTPSVFRKTFIEECELVRASERHGVAELSITDSSRGQRRWLACPNCSRRMFKLYRPPNSQVFACRKCHDLTYRSVQEHDARLDRLLTMPDQLLSFYVLGGTVSWRLLAIRAGYIRLGLITSERGKHARTRLQRGQNLEPGLTKSIGKLVATEDFLDAHLMDIIVQEEHPRWGAQDQIRAIEIGYQKLGLIADQLPKQPTCHKQFTPTSGTNSLRENPFRACTHRRSELQRALRTGRVSPH